MHRTRTIALITISALGVCAVEQASAQLPMPAATPGQAVAIDDLIQQRLEAFRDWTTTTDRQTVQMRVPYKAAELLEGLEPAALSARQIERLLPLILTAREPVAAARVRLETLVDSETLDGLLAQTVGVALAAYSTPPSRPSAAAIESILSHPAFDEAIRSGYVLTPFLAISVADRGVVKPHADRVLAIAGELDGKTLSPEQAQSLSRYWRTAQAVAPSGDDRLDDVRRLVAGALRSVASRETDPALVSSLLDQVAQIDGASARGELLDHAAPDVSFLWTSGEADFGSLADLRGKVVMLDFWATWCNPCIHSFPKLRDLVARYKGLDVVIIGVTTPQGRHHGADGTRITTGDDRDREYDLMAEFIRQKDMTWPVAFSERAAWTEFGVTGIPHVAIIDAEGVVRHNGINPLMSSEAELIQKIDALLAEAGLASPEG